MPLTLPLPRSCSQCGEPLYEALNTFGTPDEPLCVVCQAGREVDAMIRQGFSHDELMALLRIGLRETDRRHAEQMRRQTE